MPVDKDLIDMSVSPLTVLDDVCDSVRGVGPRVGSLASPTLHGPQSSLTP